MMTSGGRRREGSNTQNNILNHQFERSTAVLDGRLQSLDWTSGLDWWTGLVDWTGGLDWWTGLVD